jgi:hypothetical protein
MRLFSLKGYHQPGDKRHAFYARASLFIYLSKGEVDLWIME